MASHTNGIPPNLRGKIGDESDEDIIMDSQDNQIRKRKKTALLTMGSTLPEQAQSQDTQEVAQPTAAEKNKNEQKCWRPPIITEFPKDISGPFKIIVQPERTANSPAQRLLRINLAKLSIPMQGNKKFLKRLSKQKKTG